MAMLFTGDDTQTINPISRIYADAHTDNDDKVDNDDKDKQCEPSAVDYTSAHRDSGLQVASDARQAAHASRLQEH